MKIERQAAKHGSVAPAALGVLPAVPDELFHHAAWSDRHPLQRYSLSVEEARGALDRASTYWEQELQAFRAKGELEDRDELLRSVRDVVDRMREHIDDCYAVLLALTEPPPDLHKAKLRPERHLKAFGMPGLKRFQSTVEDYLPEYLAPLVNGLKHRGAVLHQVALWAQGDMSRARLGYYVEEAWDGDTVGPSWEVHRDGNSGFSFSRDLRLHFHYLYELSERMAEVMTACCWVKHRIELTPAPTTDHKERWLSLAKRLAEHPYEPLPNEFEWPAPQVAVSEVGGLSTLVLNYPTRQFNGVPLLQYRIQVGSSGGRSFKVPYAGNPERRKSR